MTVTSQFIALAKIAMQRSREAGLTKQRQVAYVALADAILLLPLDSVAGDNDLA